MASANKDSFTSYFPIITPLVVFSHVIALANAWNMILNSSGDMGTLALFLILEQKPVVFLH